MIVEHIVAAHSRRKEWVVTLVAREPATARLHGCASLQEQNERLTDKDCGPYTRSVARPSLWKSAAEGKSAEGAENRDCAEGGLLDPHGESAAHGGEGTQKQGRPPEERNPEIRGDLPEEGKPKKGGRTPEAKTQSVSTELSNS